MDLVIVTTVLSVCCLGATAAPQARLPWQKLSPASSTTDEILRFEPLKALDEIWEAFKDRHSTRLCHILYMLTDACLCVVLSSFDGLCNCLTV